MSSRVQAKARLICEYPGLDKIEFLGNANDLISVAVQCFVNGFPDADEFRVIEDIDVFEYQVVFVPVNL